MPYTSSGIFRDVYVEIARFLLAPRERRQDLHDSGLLGIEWDRYPEIEDACVVSLAIAVEELSQHSRHTAIRARDKVVPPLMSIRRTSWLPTSWPQTAYREVVLALVEERDQSGRTTENPLTPVGPGERLRLYLALNVTTTRPCRILAEYL